MRSLCERITQGNDSHMALGKPLRMAKFPFVVLEMRKCEGTGLEVNPYTREVEYTGNFSNGERHGDWDLVG